MRREESTSAELELILIEQINALEIYTVAGKVDPLLDGIRKKALDFVPDISTDNRRYQWLLN